ncbi:dicarboxylate/amino acid:cation symporter, partial [Faecalicoccus sp. LCP19S3_E3]
MKESKFWKQYGSVLLLLGGILIGSLIGIVSSDFGKVLKPIGDIFLNLLFTIVVPLVFVSITTAVGSMSNLKRLGKILGSTLLTFIGTGIFAAVCVLVWVNVFSPASGTSIAVTNNTVQEAQSLSDLIVSTLTVSDFYMLLDKSHMLPLIIFAILFGLCVSMSGGDESPVGKLLKNLNEIIMRFV